MDNDFNMPQAMAAIFDMIHRANSLSTDSMDSKAVYIVREHTERTITKYLKEILGLEIASEASKSFASEGVDVVDYARLDTAERKLLDERNAARKKKDYAGADIFRRMLLDRGIIIEDVKEGIVCRRKI